MEMGIGVIDFAIWSVLMNGTHIARILIKDSIRNYVKNEGSCDGTHFGIR
ncbi:uncharacterized protein M6B38_398355 [Iris pallida]|uniref:Uncharacterized protein n=1 Tax=Iris pallida TaxID=29817 RepID=A0AAX6FW67_IRIPA|nr:uncharacterized protein M6B38_398355 [Iris pallida]